MTPQNSQLTLLFYTTERSSCCNKGKYYYYYEGGRGQGEAKAEAEESFRTQVSGAAPSAPMQHDNGKKDWRPGWDDVSRLSLKQADKLSRVAKL